jgi:hypothetical protein
MLLTAISFSEILDESNARTEDAFNQILEANRLQQETCIIS